VPPCFSLESAHRVPDREKIIQGLLENSKTTKGPEVSDEIRKKVDPFYPTRDIGLIP